MLIMFDVWFENVNIKTNEIANAVNPKQFMCGKFAKFITATTSPEGRANGYTFCKCLCLNAS